MSTKLCLEIELDRDVSPIALAAWVRGALNFEPCDDPDVFALFVALEGCEGRARVTPFVPVFAELCEMAAAIYPPATEEPEEEA